MRKNLFRTVAYLLIASVCFLSPAEAGWWGDAWEWTKEASSSAWEVTKDVSSAAWEGTKEAASASWEWTKDAGAAAWEGTKKLGTVISENKEAVMAGAAAVMATVAVVVSSQTLKAVKEEPKTKIENNSLITVNNTDHSNNLNVSGIKAF